MNLNSPMATALLRAVYGAVLVFGIAVLTAHQQGQSWDQALTLGGLTGLGVLAARGGIEGRYDAKRQAAGDVKPGDVGQ